MSTRRQLLEQGRAKHAFDSASGAAKRGDKKDYKSYTKKVPMLIKSNGLGSTIAFMRSKGKVYDIILHNLEGWFKEDVKISAIYKAIPGETLMEKVVNCKTAEYRALTTESLAYLNWLKRFADGLIE